MGKPATTLWKIEPHTQAKHTILRHYLGAWFGILGPRHPRIMYLDGFCGPGRYAGGEEGSPIIALQEAMKHNYLVQNSEIIFSFIDERDDRIEHLRYEIAQLTLPKNFILNIQTGEFHIILEQVFQQAGQAGVNLVPTFAFIDPFGFKGVPLGLVRRFLLNPHTEVFVNMMIDFVNRFVEHPDPVVQQHIIDLFGTSQALDVIRAGGDRDENLRRLYLSQLQQQARFVRYFEMQNESNRAIYYLFFATNHPLGFVKMKEAFWKVDPDSGLRFSDATIPAQQVLFRLDPVPNVAQLIVQKFASQTVLTDDIRIFVEQETIYTTSQMKKALVALEADKKIIVQPVKSDGSKRKKSSFPDGVMLTFC